MHSVTLVNNKTMLTAQIASHYGGLWFKSLLVISVCGLHVHSANTLFVLSNPSTIYDKAGVNNGCRD